MRFIVTGTPRSGTRYSAKLMAALGLACEHEKTLRPSATVLEVARWPEADSGESSWMAWSVLSLLPCEVPVLHTIRDPWAVIDSLTNRNAIMNPIGERDSQVQSVRRLIDAYLPGVMQMPERVDRAAAFVLGWNRLIDERVPTRLWFPVDRLDVDHVALALRYIGTSRTTAEIEAALAEVSTSTNSGFTVDPTDGISNPDVAKWVLQYAKELDVGQIFTRKIRDVAKRETRADLAARMDPGLVDRINDFASRHGYEPAAELAAA